MKSSEHFVNYMELEENGTVGKTAMNSRGMKFANSFEVEQRLESRL